MKQSYRDTDKMFDVICDEYRLLQMLSRFDIPLGFGERTVRDVCESNDVDVETFLAVANFISVGPEVASYYVDKLKVGGLMTYLRRAHSYFLDFQIPAIRRTLVGAINCASNNQVSYLIIKFFDDYMSDVRKHMEFENDKVFVYVDHLLNNETNHVYNIRSFEKSHVGMDKKLQELKNLIIKYYKTDETPEQINDVLFDLFSCEKDMKEHCELEDLLFVPAVEILEDKVERAHHNGQMRMPEENMELSEREREVVQCIAEGLSNKEVAERLFISVNTVLTHRKNIFRKLDIHSVSALTIYAVVNGIIKVDDLNPLDLE